MRPAAAIFGLLLGTAGVVVALNLRADNERYWFIPLILIFFGAFIARSKYRRAKPSGHGSRFDNRTAGGDVCDSSDGCGDGGGGD